jgi:hypothetical protein
MKQGATFLTIAALAMGSFGALNARSQRGGPIPRDDDERGNSSSVTVSAGSLTFTAIQNGAAPTSQSVTANSRSRSPLPVAISVPGNGHWLAVSPTGSIQPGQSLTVLANPSGLQPGTYTATILIGSGSGAASVAVTLVVRAPSGGGGGSGGGTTSSAGYKLIGWNDLGMHCQDGKDFSVFAVLPPYNTIHAHLLDSSGKLVTVPAGFTVTYQAVNDPLTNTLNTTSSAKTNFWQYAAALGFGALSPDTGLKGYAMPGSGNTPRAMAFNAPDNTWMAEGIPMMPYADAPNPPYPVNYFPMMRLVARNASGTVLASTDIVLPVSDEMNCSLCHSSKSISNAARPAAGWVNDANPARDVKLNILRRHDDAFAGSALFRSAATAAGYSQTGLEAASAIKPLLCANCHASNALSKPGFAGVASLTAAMHGRHASAIDPVAGGTLGTSTTRQSCYLCHPGPATECLRGAMANVKTAAGANAIECENCHGPMSAVAASGRSGWLDEPNCQGCHTGTATSNSGQIVYTSAFSSGTTPRAAADLTFATNADTPAAGTSLFRFSKGHGGLQCEACHGSTHAEGPTSVVNDNVQATALQGHAGSLAECGSCHGVVPNTTAGGPHGMHPVGASWVSAHHDIAQGSGRVACQACHGTDYRGTVLSKMQANRTMAGKSFTRGTVVGCYSCHNGPNGG